MHKKGNLLRTALFFGFHPSVTGLNAYEKLAKPKLGTILLAYGASITVLESAQQWTLYYA